MERILKTHSFLEHIVSRTDTLSAFRLFNGKKKQKPDAQSQALKILFLTLWFFFEANVLSVKTFRALLNFERYFLTRF